MTINSKILELFHQHRIINLKSPCHSRLLDGILYLFMNIACCERILEVNSERGKVLDGKEPSFHESFFF